MDTIDMRAVVFMGVLIEITCTLVIVALWRQNRKRFDGLGHWAINFTLQTVGLLLITLRGSIAGWISIIISNTLVAVGAFLGYLGLERFTGKRGQQTHNYVLLGAFALLHGYFTYVQPNLAARNLNSSAVLFLISFQCLWLTLRRVEVPMRRLTRWVGVVFGVYSLVCVLRIISISLHPLADSDFFHSGTIEIIFQVIFELLMILLTYGLVLMVNKRLLLEIQTQEEKFSKAFHRSPYAVVLTRLSDGKVIEVNSGFEKMSGFPQEEVLGRTTTDLHFWGHIEDREDLVRTLLLQGSVQETERQFTHKSGAVITALFSAEIITIGNEQCILASINDITERKRIEDERERLISEREKAILEARTLSGLLPICASCKKIRDDKGYWNQIESYIKSHSQAEFSHGICPDCLQRLYPEYISGNVPKLR